MSLGRQIFQRILQSFSEVSTSIFEKAKRPKIIGVCLVLIRFFLLFQCHFSTQYTEEPILGNRLSLSFLFLFKKFQDGQYQRGQEIALYFFLALNASMVFYFLLRMILKIVNSKFHSKSSFFALNLMFQVYNYAFSMPSFFLCLGSNQYLESIKIINLLLTIFNCFFTAYGDNNYRFKAIDANQKRKSRIILLDYFADYSVVLFYFYCSSLTVLYLFLGIIFSIKFVFYLWRFPYFNDTILTITLSSTFFCFLTSVILLFASNQSLGVNSSDAILAILLSISLSIVIGISALRLRIAYIVKKCYNYTLNFENTIQFKQDQSKNIDELIIDVYCRHIISKSELFFREYSLSPFSIFFEQIIVNHMERCNQDACFCKKKNNQGSSNEVPETMIERELFLSSSQRKQFLDEYIQNCYLSVLNQSSSLSDSVDLYFTYLFFLSEITQKYNLLFLEMQLFQEKLKNHQQLTFLQSRLNVFAGIIHVDYCNIASTQKRFKHNESNNSILAIIQYDQELAALEDLFKLCVQQKLKILHLISQPQFALKSLSQDLKMLFNYRSQLRITFMKILRFCCYSSYLFALCEAFEYSLKSNSKLIKLAKQVKSLSPYASRIPLYSEDTCVAFLSLQKKSMGDILQVSHNFHEIIGANSNAECIGKNVDILMPNEIAKQHKQLLQQFFQQAELSLEVFSKPYMIGVDQQGWATTYTVIYQVSFMDNMANIGLACHIGRPSDNRQHFIVNCSQQLNVFALSEELFAKYFKGTYLRSEIKQISLVQWIPLMSSWESILAEATAAYQNNTNMLIYGQKIEDNIHSLSCIKNRVECTLETIFIKPQKHLLQFQLNQQTIYEDLMEMQLYAVVINLSFVDNPHLKFISVSISEIELLDNKSIKQEFINNFNQQIQKYAILEGKQNQEEPQNEGLSINQQPLENFQLKKRQTSHYRDSLFGEIEEESELSPEQPYNSGGLSGIMTERGVLSSRNILLGGKQTFPQNNKGVDYSYQQSVFSPVTERGIITVNNEQTTTQPMYQEEKSQLHTTTVFQMNENLLEESIISPNLKQAVIDNQAHKNSVNVKRDKLPGQSMVNSGAQQNSFGDSYFQFNARSPLIKQPTIKPSQATGKSNNNINKDIHSTPNNLTSSKSHTLENQEHKSFKIAQTQNNNQQDENMSTVGSQVSTTKQQKELLHQFIFKKSGMRGIKTINSMGGFSLLMIGVVSLINFFNNFSTYSNDQQNFEFVNWMNSLSTLITLTNTDLIIYQLLNLGLFSLTDDAKVDLSSALPTELLTNQQQIQQLLTGLANTNNQNLIVFSNIIGKTSTQNIYSGDNTPIEIISSSFIYDIITQAAYIDMEANLLDSEKAFQKNAELNYWAFNRFASNLTDVINESFSTQSTNQKDNIFQWFFVFLSISLLFSLSVIPSYTFVVNKQSQVLRLLSMFDSTKIANMQENLYNCEECFRSFEISTKRKTFFTKDLNNQITKKKKNTRDTTPLQPPYVKLTLIVLAFFAALQIQPLTDYFISSTFLNNCSSRYSLVVIIMNMQSTIFEIIQSRQSYVLSRFYPSYAMLPLADYAKIVQIRSENDSVILANLLNIVQQRSSYESYSADLMERFFFKTIEGNTCTTVGLFPEYQGTINFDVSGCSTANKGILAHGLAVTMQDFVTGFITFYQQTLQADDAVFLINVNQFFTNMRDRFYANKYMTQSLEILIAFLKILNYDSYDSQLFTMQLLILWQLCVIVVVFLVGYFKYSKHLEDEIMQTKKYLDLFELSILFSNPYIHSFLKQNQ